MVIKTENGFKYIEEDEEDCEYTAADYLDCFDDGQPKYDGILPDTATFFDVETANANRASICSIGISKWENGKEIDHYYSLCRPTPFFLSHTCKSIHHLEYYHLSDAPSFESCFEEFKHLLAGTVIAHNAKFDMDCLSTALYKKNIEFPSFKFLCTVELACCIHKFAKLDALAKYYDIKQEEHHNALDDARTCAKIYFKLKEELPEKYDKFYEFTDRIAIEERQSRRHHKSDDLEDAEETTCALPFTVPETIDFKNGFLVTGEFTTLSRKEIEQKINDFGGTIKSSPSRNVKYCVVGNLASGGWKNGNYGSKIENALKYPNILFVKEEDFVKYLNIPYSPPPVKPENVPTYGDLNNASGQMSCFDF